MNFKFMKIKDRKCVCTKKNKIVIKKQDKEQENCKYFLLMFNLILAIGIQ